MIERFFIIFIIFGIIVFVLACVNYYFVIEQTRALTGLYNRSKVNIDTQDLISEEIIYVSPER